MWGVDQDQQIQVTARGTTSFAPAPDTLPDTLPDTWKVLVLCLLNEWISLSPPRLSKPCSVGVVFCFLSQEAKEADGGVCFCRLFSPIDTAASSTYSHQSEVELCSVVLRYFALAGSKAGSQGGSWGACDGAGVLSHLGLNTEAPNWLSQEGLMSIG